MRRAQKKQGKKSLSQKLIRRFQSFRWKHWAIYCVVLLGIGRVIDYRTQRVFPHFLLHQILLIAATTLLVSAMRSYFKSLQSFRKDSDEKLLSKTFELRGLYEKRFLLLMETKWTFLISLLITVFFFFCIFLLDYIKLDIIGIYAIYIAGSSVLIGVYGYLQYLYFLWFLYQAGKCQFQRDAYELLSPAKTDWIIQLAKMSQRLRNYFLGIGLIYVIEYSLLVPVDKISFTASKINLDTPNNMAFVISWIALFLLVIIAFPIINYAQGKLIERLVGKLKSQTIGDLSELMNEEQRVNTDRKDRMLAVVSYSTVIESIRQSNNYPIRRHFSYEALMTILTLIVHIANIYTKIASIPFFSW